MQTAKYSKFKHWGFSKHELQKDIKSDNDVSGDDARGSYSEGVSEDEGDEEWVLDD